MSWFRLDDGFALHPKVITAGNAAVGLWVRAACWSAAQLTDGRIPDAVARTLGTAKEAKALEAAGLWRKDGNDWIIPDWLQYQPSAAQVREQQRAKSEAKQRAGRLGGIRSGEARTKQARSNDEAEGQAGRQAERKQNEAPSHPIPSPSSNPTTNSGSVAPGSAGGGGGGGGGDGYAEALRLAVDAEQAAERNPIGKIEPWRTSVRQRIERTHGAAIRAALAAGQTPAEAAAIVRPTEPASAVATVLRGAWK